MCVSGLLSRSFFASGMLANAQCAIAGLSKRDTSMHSENAILGCHFYVSKTFCLDVFILSPTRINANVNVKITTLVMGLTALWCSFQLTVVCKTTGSAMPMPTVPTFTSRVSMPDRLRSSVVCRAQTRILQLDPSRWTPVSMSRFTEVKGVLHRCSHLGPNWAIHPSSANHLSTRLSPVEGVGLMHMLKV